ncbi:MAG: ABC transporter permease [Erysipelotrichia bacterium]|nr:ABC transporter permease [Erysipelotrichia bacterium]
MITRIAWRNLWRNRRRTQLTMGAMIFACAMLVFSLGYYDGMLWNLINNATAKESGHICIAKDGYLAAPAIDDNIDETFKKTILEQHIPEITGVCQRLNVFALLSCGKDNKSRTQPAQIMGVDFKAELGASHLAEEITTGNFLSGEPGEILLGRGLARRINANIGSEVVFFSNAADGSIAAEILFVKGIFNSGDNLKDSSLAIANIGQMQSLMALDGKIHSLRIFLNNPMIAQQFTQKLADPAKKISATPWHDMFPQIADLLRVWKGMQLFTTAVYYAALALITLNTVSMAFFERRHEFAVMQAIGLTRIKLATMILAESLFMATISGIIGTTIGSTLNLILYYHPLDLSRWIENISWGGTTLQASMFCVPSASSMLLPLITMILLGFLVAAIPTFRLYRLKPVEALREA